MTQDPTQPRRRVLVAYGSKRGGTAGIAEAIAAELRTDDLDVDCLPARSVRSLDGYEAVVLGGALYATFWHKDARRFANRHLGALRRRPVWMFSSGPLDASANDGSLPAPPRVAALMKRIGARGHVMFGGRLAPDAEGFVAAAMAKQLAGDWRDWDQVKRWARSISGTLAVIPRRLVPPVLRPRRWPLAALCFAVGVTAIAGGLALVARPDGALVHADVALLAHSPFHSFLVPGLLLLLVVGLGNVIAAALVIRDGITADAAAFAAGTALFVWIVVQMLMLRTANPLQLVYLALGLVIMSIAFRRHGAPRRAVGT